MHLFLNRASGFRALVWFVCLVVQVVLLKRNHEAAGVSKNFNDSAFVSLFV
jgi:hypothetical protein